MGSMYIDDVLKTASDWVGYKEGENNWNYFADYLDKVNYFKPQKKQNVAWCHIFIDAIFTIASAPDTRSASEKQWDAKFFLYQPSTGNLSASCIYGAKYFRDNNEFYTSNPKRGDIIYFGSKGNESHVGIIEKIEGDIIHTIEGNKNNSVCRATYKIGASNIAGYGRPRYDGESRTTPTTTTNTSAEVLIKSIKQLIADAGY